MDPANPRAAWVGVGGLIALLIVTGVVTVARRQNHSGTAKPAAALAGSTTVPDSRVTEETSPTTLPEPTTEPATSSTGNGAGRSVIVRAPATPSGPTTSPGRSTAGPSAPSPGGRLLLDLRGSGPGTSGRLDFGQNWALAWAWDCRALGRPGTFEVDVEAGTDLDGPTSGSTTSHGSTTQVIQSGIASDGIEQHADPGVHVVSVHSDCAWNVKVAAQ